MLEERRAKIRAKVHEMLTEHGKTTCGCGWDVARSEIYQYLLERYSPIEMTLFPLSNVFTEIELEIAGRLGDESSPCTLASAKEDSDHFHDPLEYRRIAHGILTAIKGVAAAPIKDPPTLETTAGS
jgi:hypothetical protein